MSTTILTLDEGVYQRLRVLSERLGQSPDALLDKALADYEQKVLPKNLSTAPRTAADVQAWLAGVQELQQRIIAERGYFPDSTCQHRRGSAAMSDTVVLDKLLLIPVHVEPAVRLVKPALEIAAKYDRAVYDALFVVLANDLGLQSVTADEPLYNAVHSDFPQIILLRNW
jgi:hypothetical protein